MKIDLLAHHPYKDWMILKQKEVRSNNGARNYKITYAKDRDLSERILRVAGCIMLVIASLGLVLCSKKFRECFVLSFRKRVIKEVYSPLRIEDYLWKRIMGAPSTKKLHIAALGEMPQSKKEITIRFLTQENRYFPEGSSGAASLDTGEILLELGRPESELLRTTVFELTNFQHRKRFERIDQRMMEGSITNAEEYAKESERIEYDGMRIHSEVVQKAIISNGWRPEIDHYDWLLKTKWKTFEDYWQDVKQGPRSQFFQNLQKRILSLSFSVAISVPTRQRVGPLKLPKAAKD
jgi:hypothetical protein